MTKEHKSIPPRHGYKEDAGTKCVTNKETAGTRTAFCPGHVPASWSGSQASSCVSKKGSNWQLCSGAVFYRIVLVSDNRGADNSALYYLPGERVCNSRRNTANSSMSKYFQMPSLLGLLLLEKP